MTEEKLVDHTVTQSDLDMNPDWKEDGVELGDIIQIDEETHNDLIELSKSEETNEEEEIEETEEEEVSSSKTVVPKWARLEGEDASEPIENTLVQPEVEEEVIPSDNTPDWAKS